MTADEVQKYLEKETEWVSCKEIGQSIGRNTNNVGVVLRKMRKYDEVVWKKVKRTCSNDHILYKLKDV